MPDDSLLCEICGDPVIRTFWGPKAQVGVCRFPDDPNQDDQGQHVAIGRMNRRLRT